MVYEVRLRRMVHESQVIEVDAADTHQARTLARDIVVREWHRREGAVEILAVVIPKEG